MMWWGSGWGWIWMVVWWAVVLGVIIWAVVRFSGGTGGGERRGPTAREILDERFARGEIDEEEYRRRRDALGG
jgi:putative membrane protein